MNEKDSIEQYLNTLPDQTKKSLKILDKKEIGDLYHISRDGKIKEFIPFLTNRASTKEDRTVPRISTAPSLIACFIGYGAALADFDKGNYASSHGLDDYDSQMAKNKGGWYVYDFDWEFALRPDKKLLYDVNISDEVWLVNYSEVTKVYKPKIIAKVFYHSIRITRVPTGNHREVEMYIEVFDKPMRFDTKTTLTKGYWRLIGPEQANIKDFKDTKGYEFQQITKGEYLEKKKLSASLLSLEW